MTDLTFVPFEEIQAELNRRFPQWLLILRHRQEGKREDELRITFANDQGLGAVSSIGLAHAAVVLLQEQVKMKSGTLPPGPQGLDR